MLQRIKKIIKLSKKDLSSIDEEQIAQLPDAPDGKAEFFGEGTHAEFEQQQLDDKGLLKWYKRIGQ